MDKFGDLNHLLMLKKCISAFGDYYPLWVDNREINKLIVTALMITQSFYMKT